MSVSGTGSSLQATALLRACLPEGMSKFAIRTLVDAPCGDMTWIRRLDYRLEQYVGVDIVPALIERLRGESWEGNRDFLCADITSDELPHADALFCRDCLVHLPYDAIFSAGALWKRAGFEYVLTTTVPEHSNRDCRAGSWRPLNLERPLVASTTCPRSRKRDERGRPQQ